MNFINKIFKNKKQITTDPDIKADAAKINLDNSQNENDFDYGNADRLIHFEGTHPKVIEEKLNLINWKFTYDLSTLKSNLTLRRRFLQWIEITFGKRIFEYKNYKLVCKHD